MFDLQMGLRFMFEQQEWPPVEARMGSCAAFDQQVAR